MHVDQDIHYGKSKFDQAQASYFWSVVISTMTVQKFCCGGDKIVSVKETNLIPVFYTTTTSSQISKYL